MMCGTAENQVPEWRARVVVYQKNGKKQVLDLSAWLFWCFFPTSCRNIVETEMELWYYGTLSLQEWFS